MQMTYAERYIPSRMGASCANGIATALIKKIA
jgi:hypothetical protein